MNFIVFYNIIGDNSNFPYICSKSRYVTEHPSKSNFHTYSFGSKAACMCHAIVSFIITTNTFIFISDTRIRNYNQRTLG